MGVVRESPWARLSGQVFWSCKELSQTPLSEWAPLFPCSEPSHFTFLVPNFLLLVTPHQLLSLQRVSSPMIGRKACLSPMWPALPKPKDT